MRVLWLCNQMPALVADSIKKESSNKEGWVTGTMETLLKHAREDDIQPALAFPVPRETPMHGMARGVEFFGFYEDSAHPENYDPALVGALGLICDEFRPDVIHVFGTEYPHTLALLRVSEWKSRVVVHIQGVMQKCEEVYFGGLPESVTQRASFRDILRRDSLARQKEKYRLRALNEADALVLAERVCGRTAFDKEFYQALHPDGNYYSLNETLRPCFYEGDWTPEGCVPHSIVVPQGNIPLKGVHVMIEALALLKDRYPDATLTVAGDNILRGGGLMNAVKRCGYGKYLRKRIAALHLQDAVHFIGQKKDEEMKALYLSSEAFVLPSFVENSPNSLGEAMLLGLPAIASRVGGIPSMAKEDEELRFVEAGKAEELAAALTDLFEDKEKTYAYAAAARKRAVLTFDREANYRMLRWIYETVIKENS